MIFTGLFFQNSIFGNLQTQFQFDLCRRNNAQQQKTRLLVKSKITNHSSGPKRRKKRTEQAISDGYGISDVPHWNKEKYPNQRIITVLIGGYAHLVPYVMDGDDYFLKTIIPNRKENKKVKGE